MGTSAISAGTIAGGAGGATLTEDINQATHGFVVGDWVRLNGTSYTKAQADSIANVESIGVVTAVADADNFTIQFGGKVEGLSGLTAGQAYFIDPDTAGGITVTEPTTIGDVSKPVLVADSATTGYLFNYRGAEITQQEAVGNSFGDWQARSVNTIYQATTDGIVTVRMTSDSNNIRINVSDFSPPTTMRIINQGPASGDSGFSCPIKAGEYWEVTTSGSGAVVWFRPLEPVTVLLNVPSGQVVQTVNYETGAYQSGTTTIPSNDNIPQNTQGNEFMTLAITPTSATSKLKIEVMANVGSASAGSRMVVALFQDSVSDAIACCESNLNTNETMAMSLNHFMTAGTISETTFKVRIGSHNGSATTCLNGLGSRLRGGVSVSSITITEISG